MFLITFVEVNNKGTWSFSAPESATLDTALLVAKWVIGRRANQMTSYRLQSVQVIPDVSDKTMREVGVRPLRTEDFTDWAQEQKEQAA